MSTVARATRSAPVPGDRDPPHVQAGEVHDPALLLCRPASSVDSAAQPPQGFLPPSLVNGPASLVRSA